MRRHLVALLAAVGCMTALGSARARALELHLVSDADYPRSEPSKPADFSLSMIYAQSAQAWATYSDIQDAHGDLSAINSLLKQNYGSYEEVFGRFDVGLDGVRTHLSWAPLEQAYFHAATEALATAVAENPVVPELHAATMAAGLVSTGFETPARAFGFRASLGGTLGSGYEKRVDAYSTDIIDSTPIRSGNFYFYGMDAMLEDHVAISRQLDLLVRASDRETMFVSEVPPASLSYGSESPFWAHHWRLDSELGDRVKALGGGRFFAQGIVGPQPLPVEILPRIWDYAHALDPAPELGTLLGGGLGWETHWGRKSSLRAVAGFYGGYVGAGLTGRIGIVSASAGSWGIEGSSAYQTLGQRVWIGSLGLEI